MSLHNHRDEDGMALVTSLLVMLVSVIVVTAVLQLATHSAQRSGLSRDRQAALNAAQAGIQAELSLISDGTCPVSPPPPPPPPATPTTVTLPDQNLPTESYTSYVLNPLTQCSVGGPAIVVSTGYVPNATNPTATTTIVAHINRSQGAPVSGGGVNGGYDFPDAIFTDGGLTTTNLSLYGSGGAIPNVTGNGAVSISGSQIAGSVTGQTSVSLSSSQVGGNVFAGTSLAYNSNITVTGAVAYGGGAPTHTGGGTVTINGSQTGGAIAGLNRPFPKYTYSATDIGGSGAGQLGVGATIVSSCPAAWTASFYNFTGACTVSTAAGAYNPSAANKNTVIVTQGALNVTLPPTAVGGQLYIVDMGTPASDTVTITGNGSTLPVFVISDGSVSVSGTIVGQVLAHSLGVTATGTMTFAPPATPMPDLAFPSGYTPPAALTATGAGAFVSTVTFQYQCPGFTAC